MVPDDCKVTRTLGRLLEPLGETPTFKMGTAEELEQKALKSLVEGLVQWSDRRGKPRIAETLDLLHWLIGDPRLNPACLRWTDIDQTVRVKVECWLKDISQDAFFRFIRDMRVGEWTPGLLGLP